MQKGTPSTFIVEYAVDDTDHGEADACSQEMFPVTPSASSTFRETRTQVPSSVQFVTPPTGELHDSEGILLRYRMMEDAIDHAEPVELEYSRLCLLAAEEPGSVKEALAEGC